MTVLRGDIFWVEPGPVLGAEQAGRRPYLVVSREMFNESQHSVIAMAITSRAPRSPFPLAHRLESARLPKPSWVKVGQVRTISTLRLGRRIGRIHEEEVDRIVDGLLDIVGP